SEVELDLLCAQDFSESLAEWCRLSGQHVLRGVDDRHFAAQPSHRLGHLNADWAATEDDEPARHALHPGHFTVGPDAVELTQARDRRHNWFGAGRHHDVVRGVTHTIDIY